VGMAEQGIEATHEEVVVFVRKFRDFHSSLGDSEQAMMESILDTTRGEVGGYGMYKRSGIIEETWDDLVGWPSWMARGSRRGVYPGLPVDALEHRPGQDPVEGEPYTC
jgi:hypothetical protein